jgi:hypothetical protein
MYYNLYFVKTQYIINSTRLYTILVPSTEPETYDVFCVNSLCNVRYQDKCCLSLIQSFLIFNPERREYKFQVMKFPSCATEAKGLALDHSL